MLSRKRDARLPWLSTTTTSYVTRQENTSPPEIAGESTGLSPMRGPSNSSSGGTQPLFPMKEAGSEVRRSKSHLSTATERTVQGTHYHAPRVYFCLQSPSLLGCISASKAPPPYLALPAFLRASGPEMTGCNTLHVQTRKKRQERQSPTGGVGRQGS